MTPARLFYFLTFLFCTLVMTGTEALALDVNKVRFGVHHDKTRMVIELSDKTEFRTFMLPEIENKPYRLVVDMPNFNWKAGTIKRPPKTTILDVRSGTLNASTKRLVIDLEQPAKIITAFILPADRKNKDRLVIDYSTVTKAQFATIKRNPLGTLPNTSGDLNLLIASQTANEINTPQNVDKATTAIVTPARKPSNLKTKPTTKTKSTITKSPLRKPLIVIDAGHGGQDPGAIGAENQREKNVTLSAAKILKKKLESTGRYRAALTRSNDKYIKLSKRVGIARHQNADLFISLHADSIGRSDVRGASIYTLSNKSSDAQTAKLAKRENQSDLIAGIDLSHEDKEVANILIDLAMRDTMNQSKFFANNVVTHMKKHKLKVLPRPHRYAGFAVLKAPDIPSVLVEMGFMSNRAEARLLSTPLHQAKIANVLTDSIDSYFQKLAKNSQ